MFSDATTQLVERIADALLDSGRANGGSMVCYAGGERSIDASDLPAIELGRSQQLRPGEWVLALGHPWGQIGAATGGVVIDPCADLPEMETGREWLTVSLHLRPGHSGGPLIDAQGRLVGINTMMNGPDVGVAVPVHVVKRFLRESLERETARV